MVHYAAMRLRICTIYQFGVHSQSCCVHPDHHLTPTCTKETKSYLQEQMGQHPLGIMKDGWNEIRKNFLLGSSSPATHGE
jgi:hypothetical protein